MSAGEADQITSRLDAFAGKQQWDALVVVVRRAMGGARRLSHPRIGDHHQIAAAAFHVTEPGGAQEAVIGCGTG